MNNPPRFRRGLDILHNYLIGNGKLPALREVVRAPGAGTPGGAMTGRVLR